MADALQGEAREDKVDGGDQRPSEAKPAQTIEAKSKAPRQAGLYTSRVRHLPVRWARIEKNDENAYRVTFA